jgi:hypothetical protein
MTSSLRTLLVLFALGLLLVGCAKSTWRGPRQPVAIQGRGKTVVMAEKKAELPPKLHEGEEPPWDVRGWGLNREDAEKDARKKAAEKVTAYLRRQQPPTMWTVTSDYVRDCLQIGSPERHKELDKDLGEAKAKCWTIRVKVSSKDLAAMARLAQQEQAEQRRAAQAAVSQERMAILGRILVGLLAAAGALVVYVRLDNWTKGRYSRRLAVGVGVAALLVSLVVWAR